MFSGESDGIESRCLKGKKVKIYEMPKKESIKLASDYSGEAAWELIELCVEEGQDVSWDMLIKQVHVR